MFFPYPYMGMDFQGDPDIGLPFGYVWGPAGMCYILLHLFESLCTYVFCFLTLTLFWLIMQMLAR